MSHLVDGGYPASAVETEQINIFFRSLMQAEIDQDINSICRSLDPGISAVSFFHQFAFHEFDLIHVGPFSDHTAEDRIFDPAHFFFSERDPTAQFLTIGREISYVEFRWHPIP